MSNDGDSDSASESRLPPAKRQKVDQGPSQCDQQGSPQEVPEPIPSTSKEETGLENKSNVSNDEFNDFVTPEEVEKLREFRVLDEVKSNDEDSNGECDDSESSSAESGELPEEEIEKMLEEDLPEGFKAAPKPKKKPYVTREKVILEEKGVNHFEVLPLDWIMIRHQSGMPVYVHRATRVCTLSKPYFLGKGNAKRHDIPISAIPCLAYRRALQEEEKQKLIDQKVQEQIKLGTWKKQTDNNAMKLAETDQSNNPCKSEEANSRIDITDESTANVKDSTSLNGPDEVKSESLCPYKRGLIISSNTVCPISKLTSEINGNSNEKTSESSQSNEELADANATTNSKMEVANDDVQLVENATEIPTSIELSSNKTKDLEQTDLNEETNDESGEKSASQIKDESGEKSVTENKTCEESNETAKNDIEIPDNRQPIVLPGGIVMPSPRVETVNTSWKTQHLTHEQVTEYCKKLFKFKILNIMHFKCWADRRKYTKARKALQYPMLPEGTKLITIPAQQSLNGTENANGSGKTAKRDWVMNMNGRSYLSVFHEYVRRALQKQPVYEFKQLENASMPYQATVYIGGMQYGVGRGSSKRQAKSAAARESIHILIPEMKDHLEPDNDAEPDFVFFDYVGIEDPRITEFCAATCEPTPHAILRTCLLRNFGAGDRHIHTEMKKLEYQKIELTMRVGKHSATVVCKNKKTAKQRASQAILQALHPHVRSWGSLLRLYGSRSVKSCKEKKLEEQQITLLQDKARHNEPNYAVLEKLRSEMRKLRERDAAVVPIGTLLLAAALPAHSGSNLNTVDL